MSQTQQLSDSISSIPVYCARYEELRCILYTNVYTSIYFPTSLIVLLLLFPVCLVSAAADAVVRLVPVVVAAGGAAAGTGENAAHAAHDCVAIEDIDRRTRSGCTVRVCVCRDTLVYVQHGNTR